MMQEGLGFARLKKVHPVSDPIASACRTSVEDVCLAVVHIYLLLGPVGHVELGYRMC